jgi:hypothetical protein
LTQRFLDHAAGYHATAAERAMGRLQDGGYRSRMDITALAMMASAFTFSGFVVLLGWR